MEIRYWSFGDEAICKDKDPSDQRMIREFDCSFLGSRGSRRQWIVEAATENGENLPFVGSPPS